MRVTLFVPCFADTLAPGAAIATVTILERLGHETIAVDSVPFAERRTGLARRLQWRLRLGPMVREYNAALETTLASRPDVLWVDKGILVLPETLASARRQGVRWLVHYSPDNYLLQQTLVNPYERQATIW